MGRVNVIVLSGVVIFVVVLLLCEHQHKEVLISLLSLLSTHIGGEQWSMFYAQGGCTWPGCGAKVGSKEELSG